MNDENMPRGMSEVTCTRCGAHRIKREDGTPGACSLIGCPAPLFDAEVEQGLRAPPPRCIAIAFNATTKKVDIEATDRATFAWLHRKDVVDYLATRLPEMSGVRIMRDVVDGEREPPADIMTPKRMAAWIHDVLSSKFPDDDIAVVVAPGDTQARERMHPACPTCSCASARPSAS